MKAEVGETLPLTQVVLRVICAKFWADARVVLKVEGRVQRPWCPNKLRTVFPLGVDCLPQRGEYLFAGIRRSATWNGWADFRGLKATSTGSRRSAMQGGVCIPALRCGEAGFRARRSRSTCARTP